MMKNEKPEITLHGQHKECIFKFRGNGAFIDVYYPCLHFLKARFELFDSNKIGAFVWEAG